MCIASWSVWPFQVSGNSMVCSKVCVSFSSTYAGSRLFAFCDITLAITVLSINSIRKQYLKKDLREDIFRLIDLEDNFLSFKEANQLRTISEEMCANSN